MKIRRGLGTSDDAVADVLVQEMNMLLADETYWNLTERPRAEQRFSSPVVRAFFEPMASPLMTNQQPSERLSCLFQTRRAVTLGFYSLGLPAPERRRCCVSS